MAVLERQQQGDPQQERAGAGTGCEGRAEGGSRCAQLLPVRARRRSLPGLGRSLSSDGCRKADAYVRSGVEGFLGA